MNGTNGSVFAIGDCTASSYAPTAQVASQQGAYLARVLAQMAKKNHLEGKLLELESASVATVDEEERKKFLEEADEVQKQLAKVKVKPFHYSHQGSLAYVFCFFPRERWIVYG
jgi:NADH:ubiquinone reductase (non-electrogenic)